MACFVVPVAEAIVVSTVSKVLKSKEEKKADLANIDMSSCEGKISSAAHLQKLSNFLWGGSALLAFEHIWHGEVSPFFPFLTAAANSVDFAEMLHEMSTVGVTMALVVTGFWAALTYIETKVKAKEEYVQK